MCTCIHVYGVLFLSRRPSAETFEWSVQSDRTTHKLKKSSEDECVCLIDSFCIRSYRTKLMSHCRLKVSSIKTAIIVT